MFGGLLGVFAGPSFECELRGFPVSVIKRDDLETGSRLVLPASVLQGCQRAGADGTLLFEICDRAGTRRTHGGVLEFTAPAQMCYVPAWMLRQLEVEEGGLLRIALRKLPKATFVKLRPDSVALMRVYNPRALLESGLRGYVAVTEGDVFSVQYRGAAYQLEVVEVRPAEAACIIDADVEVEFATPKEAAAAATASRSRADDDAWLPQGAASAVASRAASRSAEDASSSRLFAGAGQRIDGGDPLALEEEVDPMPWRRRVKGGVKYTAPPYGCERIRLVGEAAPGKPLAQPLSGVAPASISREGFVRPPESVAPAAGATPAARGVSRDSEAQRSQALRAAEAREAAQAEEIGVRRREEAEEQERQRVAAQEAQERARREAAEKERRRRALMQAPAQQRMDGGARGKGGQAAAQPGMAACCGCCYRGRPGAPGGRPEVRV